MMKTFFRMYQYLAFLVLFPFSVFIWQTLLGNIYYTLYIISLPVLVAYIIPGIGTNVTKLWEINTKYRLGQFRLYHGFVLGASVTLFGYICYSLSPEYGGLINTIFFSLVLGSFVGFWNWYYDIYAVEAGFIVIYNKKAYENKSAAEIVTDYAPIYFGVFGFMYGLYIKFGQYYFAKGAGDNWDYVCIAALSLGALVVPTLVYALVSYANNKDFGLAKYVEKTREVK